jgi:DNA modification methylase
MPLPCLDAAREMDCVRGMRELPDACIDLVFTSPPYADLRRETRVRPDDYAGWFLPAAFEIRRVLKDRGSLVLNLNDRCVHGARHLFVFKLVVAMAEVVRMPLIETYIWHKPNPMPGLYGPRPKDAFEYVFWFGKTRDVTFNLADVGVPPKSDKRGTKGLSKRSSGRPMKDAAARGLEWTDPGNVITCPVARGRSSHSARMPEALARFFIRLASNPGDVVLDPFLGSGTTARVARRLGRHWLGFDLRLDRLDLD